MALLLVAQWAASQPRRWAGMQLTFSAMPGAMSRPPAARCLCDPWFTPAYFGAWFPFPAMTGSTLPSSAGPITCTCRISTVITSTRTSSPGTSARTPAFSCPIFRRRSCAASWGGARFPRLRAHDGRRTGRSRWPGGRDLRDDGTRRRALGRLEPRARCLRAAPEPERRAARRSRCLASARSVRRAPRPVLGAIWYPIVYDFPDAERARLAADKRVNQMARAASTSSG